MSSVRLGFLQIVGPDATNANSTSSQDLDAPLSDAEWHAKCFTACVGSIPRDHHGVHFCPYTSMCSAGFRSLKRLHLHIHNGHPICLLCTGSPNSTSPTRFRDEDVFMAHTATEHRVCVFSDCRRRFTNRDALLLHYQRDHPLRCCLQ